VYLFFEGCVKTFRGKKPNILIAIADDWSWPHAGAYGCQFVNTPNFDRVAREGVLFTHAYCPAPQCGPCRGSLLTGRNIWQNDEAGTHSSYFPKKFTVFTGLLDDAGYFVGFTRKGLNPGNWEDQGWEHNPVGKDFTRNELQPPTEDIKDNDYAADFEDFLKERPKDKPFFFWYGSSEPHRSYEKGSGLKRGKKLEDVVVPSFLPDDKVIRSDLLDYAVEVEWFDKQLGKILKKLEDIGELDNTIIVVTSDNGMPFPRAKANLYEYGTHMPLAINWVDKVKGGRVVDDFVSFIDFAPTFLEAAGLPLPPEVTGRSFMYILNSRKSGWIDPSRNRVYVGRERHTHARPDNLGYPARAIRTKDYLFILNLKTDRWPAGDPPYFHDVDDSPSREFLKKNKEEENIQKFYVLSYGKRPNEELYLVEEDPGCINNLADDPDYNMIKKELQSDLLRTLKEQGDPRVLGYGVIFESYPRFAGMRSEKFSGFAERGKYNPEYVVKAYKAMRGLGMSDEEILSHFSAKDEVMEILMETKTIQTMPYRDKIE